MIQRFIDNINPEALIYIKGREYQYNTTDSEGWTYWKELGKGNDLGLKLESVEVVPEEYGEYITVVFHTGTVIHIPQAGHDHPLITIGV